MHLGLRDVVLDYFIGKKQIVFRIKSGDVLEIRANGLYYDNTLIVKLSRAICEKIDRLRLQGYIPVKAEVGFIVEWVKQETNESAAVILPNLYFRKGDIGGEAYFPSL